MKILSISLGLVLLCSPAFAENPIGRYQVSSGGDVYSTIMLDTKTGFAWKLHRCEYKNNETGTVENGGMFCWFPTDYKTAGIPPWQVDEVFSNQKTNTPIPQKNRGISK